MKVEKHKRKSGGHAKNRKLDAVEVQVSVRYKKPRGSTLSRNVIEEAVHQYAETGRLPKNFQIEIVRWKNPDSNTNKKWRTGGSQQERLKTLRGILQRGKIHLRLDTMGGTR